PPSWCLLPPNSARACSNRSLLGDRDVMAQTRAIAIATALVVACSSAADAGPPYQTDDPEPTDLRHWEIYNFIDFDGHRSNVEGEAGLDLNYGAAKGLQLTATLPIAFEHADGTGWRGGRGDIELGAKYRFLDAETR